MSETASRSERWVPGLRAARHYPRSWVRPDLVAGLVLAAILVPQGMAYAELAGLPPVTGLYTTIACLIGYAIFGPSRILVLGPDSSVSPMIFAAIVPLLAGGDPTRAIALAGMLALMVGLIEIGLGLGKLGFVADLLSNEVQVGYMNGLALVIIVGQLPKLFGYSVPSGSFGAELKAFVTGLDQTVVAAVAIGAARGGCTAGAAADYPSRPGGAGRHRWRDDHLGGRGPREPRGQHGWRLAARRPEAVAAVDLGLGRRAAGGRGRRHHPRLARRYHRDRIELCGAPRRDDRCESGDDRHRRGEYRRRVLSGVCGLHERVAHGCGRTGRGGDRGASVVGAAAVAMLLLFLNGLLADLPQSVLAAVLIAAALTLMNLDVLRRYYRVRRSALVLSLAATAGVVVLGVLPGIVIAIGLAIILFFRRSWRANGAVLGRAPRPGGWQSVARHPDARELPGLVVYRWEAPLFFANTSQFRDHVRELVRDRHASWVIIQCEAVTDVDVTAAEMLKQLDLELNAAGTHMAFAEMRTRRLQDLVSRYGLYETLDRDRFYPSVEAAVEAIHVDDPGDALCRARRRRHTPRAPESCTARDRRRGLGETGVEPAGTRLRAARPDRR